MEVSRLRSGRLSEKKKNYPTTSWYRPLSARNEHRSHPQAWSLLQASGRLRLMLITQALRGLVPAKLLGSFFFFSTQSA